MTSQDSAPSSEHPTPSNARELRAAIARPIWNGILKRSVGRGDLDYELYLRTGALLALQTPSAELSNDAELMFQVVHQAQELWLKLLAYEAASVVEALDGDDLRAGERHLDRMIRTMGCLGAELEVISTLSPMEFQVIRRNLGTGSGQESPGYNALRLASATVDASLDRLLARRGAALVGVYQREAAHADLFAICERLVDFDASFQLWLARHFALVRRTIGVDRSVAALDGMPTTMLAARATRPLFPALWDVRTDLTRTWSREGGFRPGDPRTSAVMPISERGR